MSSRYVLYTRKGSRRLNNVRAHRKVFPLMELPRELRNRIYEYAVDGGHCERRPEPARPTILLPQFEQLAAQAAALHPPLRAESRTFDPVRNLHPAITRISAEVREEALPVFYQVNAFETGSHSSTWLLRWLLEVVKPTHLKYLTRIRAPEMYLDKDVEAATAAILICKIFRVHFTVNDDDEVVALWHASRVVDKSIRLESITSETFVGMTANDAVELVTPWLESDRTFNWKGCRKRKWRLRMWVSLSKKQLSQKLIDLHDIFSDRQCGRAAEEGSDAEVDSDTEVGSDTEGGSETEEGWDVEQDLISDDETDESDEETDEEDKETDEENEERDEADEERDEADEETGYVEWDSDAECWVDIKDSDEDPDTQ